MNINVNTGADAFALFGNTSGAPTFKNLTVENITILSGNAVSTFVKQHAAGGVLTFDHVNLKTAQYSNPASGFVMTSLGSLNVQDATVQGFTISALNSFAAGIVATLRADGTFNNVLIDGFTMNYTCCNFPDYSAGLVGYAFGSPTPSMITITNSIVKNATIGGSTVFRYAGGLIGRALDMSVAISNSSFAGTIYAKDSGGLVGYVEPLFSTDRTLAITNSSVNATFSNCGNGICGGLVGWIIANGTISNSFYKGALTNNTGLSGGLVGQIDGNVSINDSYSAANLTKTGGSGTLGGIVGGISAGVVNINRSYYAGIMVAGVPPIKSGCLVAANFATLNVADAYYDDSLCTKNSVDSGGYAGANNVATGALQTAAPFVNWLPANWVFTAAQNPKLLWEP